MNYWRIWPLWPLHFFSISNRGKKGLLLLSWSQPIDMCTSDEGSRQIRVCVEGHKPKRLIQQGLRRKMYWEMYVISPFRMHCTPLRFLCCQLKASVSAPPASYTPHPRKHQKPSRATTPLTKQVTESTITQFRGSRASDQDGTSRCSMHLSGDSLFCKGKANDWVFGGIQLLDLCAFKRLCYFTALWSKLISASYVNENWYSSLCSYSFLIPIIDWNF